MNDSYILGIDVGSITAGAVVVNDSGSVEQSAYRFHNGQIEQTLIDILNGFAGYAIKGIGATTSTPHVLKGAARYDSRICVITAAMRRHDRVGSILIVGGEKFGLVRFDVHGEYLNYRSNSSCAAGTGSFLDQQAKRLNLGGIEEFSDIAYANSDEIPRIASRCAVFAKTDLIHAQQEGYSLAEICDGLSHGLARNVADTLFSNENIHAPMIFAGGVSKNRAVVRHISSMADMEVITDDYSHVYGALGAALLVLQKKDFFTEVMPGIRPDMILMSTKREKMFFYKPLNLELSHYPDFDSIERYEFKSAFFRGATGVETDIYQEMTGTIDACLGIDIGSTSTKAVLMGRAGNVMAGFYTRTAGRPVRAVQTIFEDIDAMALQKGVTLRITGVGTTGSGRKFVGRILGADLVLDEITAHARAAYELDSGVDTIIEIGGQDSKFTTMKNGMVTFSIMNNVCAAGTGSFIEEQAAKLGCGLDEYSERAENVSAPLTSDRCTVFMERDLNYYISEGYAIDELLASVLHSVRENYLKKVAIESSIGERIFFQGATAKNRALVAAFEQRLGKEIMVSRYCHLTGAMGVCLYLADNEVQTSTFRGLELYKKDIPVRTEVCELCTNHCKIRIAEVNNETIAFGFLCGRDYNTDRYVKIDKDYDLISGRNNAFSFQGGRGVGNEVSIGIPAALHLFDELPLWQRFFDILGIKTITSVNYMDAVHRGKQMTGAEFCAPISALHGHVKHLLARADYVFLPDYFENPLENRSIKRNYCYYTQYSAQTVLCSLDHDEGSRVLNPSIRSIETSFMIKANLYQSLKKVSGTGYSYFQVAAAYDQATEFYRNGLNALQALYQKEIRGYSDIAVIFLGRPYTVLSRAMNNSIPDIFARKGIKTFFQDMLPLDDNDAGVEELLGTVPWKYASHIVRAAEYTAKTAGLYPVLVTSFKCTPDSYVIELLKKIMDRYHKPYLILQLDEHDSSVGYETRIEAGIRSFRNHHGSSDKGGVAPSPLQTHKTRKGKKNLKDTVLLLPRWDSLSCRLLEAIFRNEGIETYLVDESRDSIQRSMSMNSGQCIPLTVMAQNFVNFIEKHDLDPSRVAVWNPNSQLACNIGMFPYYTKELLRSWNEDYAQIDVYVGEMTFTDLSVRAAINSYFAFMFAGYLHRIACSIRPYENNKGDTNRAVDESMARLYDVFLRDGSKENAVEEIMRRFLSIDITPALRPKVAIFGDLYVRDNDVMNQGLIDVIEQNNGEVVTTPYSEFMQIISEPYLKKWFKQGQIGNVALLKILQKVAHVMERKYYRYFNRIINEKGTYRDYALPSDEILKKFGLKLMHSGESMENILKIFYLVNKYPDLSLFVQTNPAYCCPSLVTQAMSDRIEEMTGVPVVTIEYDGTGSSKNDDVIPFLVYPRKKKYHNFEEKRVLTQSG